MYENELYHYGVLGMKWGIRRNPSKAYTKAVNKKDRMQSKAVSLDLKSAKTLSKANKKLRKAKYPSEVAAAKNLETKGLDLHLQSAKLRSKAARWTLQMDKTFKNYDIKKVPAPTFSNGRNFVYQLTRK